MNNKLIKITMGVGLSAAMLLGSVAGVSQVEPQIVQAVRSYKIKLNHKAVVYNARGQRKGALKNGRTVTAYGIKKIHGKRYYSLGAGKYIKVTTASKVGKAAQPVQNTTTEQPAANTESSSASSKSGLMSLNNSKFKEEAAESFVNQLNEMRSQRGLRKLTVKPALKAYAQTRANELVDKFSHIRPNGKRTSYEENIGLNSVRVSTTPQEAAKALLDEFIYHDQGSNWAHKKSLLSKANKTIGVGFAFEAKPGMATQGNKYPDYLGDRIAVNLQTH
ncbi:SLAP domain-containing protein [uncultured Lactobacillus sp.]|uniref:SLAP domain-containing protein n=1 Tax=uncultured Lactobacillus sp. TaxID=153152 RepID=UPI002589B3EC|nr:SLAP domain-containing protein [uncultured Lactobacillus sp.]